MRGCTPEQNSAKTLSIMLLGLHCSIRKGLVYALYEARKLGCNTMQIFTRSPRGWYRRQIPDKEIEEFDQLRKEFRIDPLIVHIPYLPNLATSDTKLYEKSLITLKEDLTLAGRLKAKYIIIHPGAYSMDSSAENGLKRISNIINITFNEVRNDVVLLLENVSGGGRRLGSSFEELKVIINNIKQGHRIGICLDTAHTISAGYPLSTHRDVNKTVRMFDSIIGLGKLKVIHLNDSYFPYNSKKDRHQHIGEGYIGLEGFRAILNHKKLKDIPLILETPKIYLNSDRKNLNTVILSLEGEGGEGEIIRQ